MSASQPELESSSDAETAFSVRIGNLMTAEWSTEEAAEGGDAGEERSAQPELLAVLRLDCSSLLFCRLFVRRALSAVIRCIALRRRKASKPWDSDQAEDAV